MLERRNTRYVPKRSNYLRHPPPDPGGDGPRGKVHAFHIPMVAASARLAALLVEVKLAADEDGVDLADTESAVPLRGVRHAVVAIETAAAVVGVCWYHPDYDLEVNNAESWRNFPDIRDFGALVWEELEEAGYSFAEVGQFLTLLADPILETVREKVVADRANFTEGETETPS